MILREIKNMYFPALQRIEYLESTGTQYIDTEFKHNNNTRFVTLLSFQSVSEWEYPFGAFGDSNKRSIFALESDYAKILYSYYGYINAKKSFNQKVKLNYLYNIDFNKNTHTINDTSVVHDTSNFSSIYNTFIFASSNYNGTPISNNKVRCYYFKIYDNGTLVRDFIPVRIGTKGYMLDKVSGELYGNSGTGDFILGQDVGSINYSKNLQQIYQNKLIKDVDYETYDWLKGDGSAYIDTGHNVNEDLDWETEVICPDTTTGTHFFWYRPRAANSSTTMIARSNNDTYVGLCIANNSNQIYWQDTSNQTVVKCDSNTIRINEVSYTVTKSYGLSQEFYLFNIKLEAGAPIQTTTNGVKCAYFRFSDSNRNYIQNLVPCTLLRSIPRNLDAQCKERQAGECGMIDLISGKFYGNVANSGTFTVENDNNE